MHVLRDELPKIEVIISSKHSPQLAEGLATGKLDAAFMRPEEGHLDLVYKVLITEPLIVVLPSDHRLVSRDAIRPLDFVGETFIGGRPGAADRRLLPAIGRRRTPGAPG
jgi:LysR family hca operon transcriptional activator